MATYFSDHFSSNGDAKTALDLTRRPSAGVGHARARKKRAYAKGLFLTTDLVRMMTVKSTDRLFALRYSTDGASTAGAVNVGIHVAGLNHDGAVVDADIFATALTATSAQNRIEAFTEATTLTGLDRGKPVWQLIGASADTGLEYDITITASTSLTVAASQIVLELDYTSGD